VDLLNQSLTFLRQCPGIELAEASIYIRIAMIISVFNITLVKDPVTGLKVFPKHEYLQGAVWYVNFIISL